VLLDAWRRQTRPGRELRIVGDGPLRDEVSDYVRNDQTARYLGRRSLEEVRELMSNAAAVLFPSLWFEGMPRTIVESLAVGTPVLASELGAMPSIIRNGENGWLASAGDVLAWTRILENLLVSDEPKTLRAAVRADYLARYTADCNYRHMMEIYAVALAERCRRSRC
jgi:glycosyltransferase involved in cell wall biosynthesis